MSSTYSDLMKQAEEIVAARSPELHRYKDKDVIGEALVTMFFLSIILMGFSFVVGLTVPYVEVEIVGVSIAVAILRAWHTSRMQSKHSKAVRIEIQRLEGVTQ